MRSSIADQHHVPATPPTQKKSHRPVYAALFIVAAVAATTLVLSLQSSKSELPPPTDLGFTGNFTAEGCYPAVDVVLLMDDSMSGADKYHQATELVLEIVESIDDATEQANRYGLVSFDSFASNVVELGAFQDSADFVTYFSDLRSSSFSSRQGNFQNEDQFCIPAAFQMGLQTTLALDANTGLVQPALTRLRPGVRTVFILVATREHGTDVFSACDASFVDCFCETPFPQDDPPFLEPVADMQNTIQQIRDASSSLYPLDIVAIGVGETVSTSFLEAVTERNFGFGQDGLPVWGNATTDDNTELDSIVANVTEVVVCTPEATRAPSPLAPTQAPTTCETADTDVVFVVDSSLKQNAALGKVGDEFVIAAVKFTSDLAIALAAKTTGTSRFSLAQFALNATSLLELTPDLTLFDETAQTILDTVSPGGCTSAGMQRAAGENLDLRESSLGVFEFGPNSLLRTGVPSTIVLITDAFATSAPEDSLTCLSEEPCDCTSTSGVFVDPRAAAVNVYDAIVEARTASGDDVLVLIVGTGSVPQRFMEEVADISLRVPTYVELGLESAVTSALDLILCRQTDGEQSERPSPTATEPPTDVPTKEPTRAPTFSPTEAPSANPSRTPTSTFFPTTAPTTWAPTTSPSETPTMAPSTPTMTPHPTPCSGSWCDN